MNSNDDTSWAESLGHISASAPLLPGSVPSSQQCQAICHESLCILQHQPPCPEPSETQLLPGHCATGMLLC